MPIRKLRWNNNGGRYLCLCLVAILQSGRVGFQRWTLAKVNTRPPLLFQRCISSLSSSPSLGYATSTTQPLHASPLSPFPRCSRGGSQHCAAVSCATLTSLAFLPFPDQCMVSIPLRLPPFPLPSLLPWGRTALCRGSTCKIKCGPSTTLTSLAFLSFS